MAPNSSASPPDSADSATRLLRELDKRERKRRQNRIAQQTYRRNQKERIRALEVAATRPFFHDQPGLSVVSPPPSTLGSCSPEIPYSEPRPGPSPGMPAVPWNGQTAPSWSCADNAWMRMPHGTIGDPAIPPDAVIRTHDYPGADYGVADEGRTALHGAVSSSSEPLVRLLLDHGADVTREDNYGNTALHLAAEAGSMEMVALLLERSTDPGRRNCMGRDVLFSAVRGRNEAIVRYFLDRGLLDVNSTDSIGNVPLHVAIEQGSEDMVRLLLLSYGANKMHNSQGRGI